MFTSLTILLIVISAAVLGSIVGGFWFRQRHYNKLVEIYNEKDATLIQLNQAYAGVNTKYSDLKNSYSELQTAHQNWKAKYNKLSGELNALTTSRLALLNDFNTFRVASVEKTMALETALKNLTADFDAKFAAFSKDYADAESERKAFHATVSNLANDKQMLITEYGNFRTEAKYKYNALKNHLDKLQNPYAAYVDEHSIVHELTPDIDHSFDQIQIIDSESYAPEAYENERVSTNAGITTTDLSATTPIVLPETNSEPHIRKINSDDIVNYNAIKIVDTFEEEHYDNLEIIEGIGPKIAQILNRNGIQTFVQLATTDIQRLRDILHTAGTRFRMHDPTTWAKQSALANVGKWDELKMLQNKLKGGRE